ncbi:T9SS type A sorting domain-containing protein [uncultured Coprobacter sp.]|uniref:T9SS type A sorting domain-containing protein n=1 Tax=uncultured Coprobacter sp. TaxID=1720550 RepID=UPI00263697E1|nr:T9SS type A sorting domain-containing protein [uncultured Coprobacter sp.]
MRTSTKLWATALLFSFSAFSLSAKDLYVANAANGGSDSNDGLTAETPVAYLSQLNDVIAAGDVIHVNGMIMMSQDPNTKPDRTSGYIHQQAGAKGHQGFVIMGGTWQNVTIIGEGLQSGFDSEHKGRLFRLNGGGNLTFKNLTFQNGRDLVNDGGNGFWIGGNLVATFEDCKFMFNTVAHANPDSPTDYADSNGRGGAIHKNEIGDMNLYNCTFTGNENREGNAINWCGGKLVAVGCSFMGNTTKINGTGGAIKFWCLVAGKPIQATIEHCLFMGNSSGNGGAIAINETADRDDAGNDITIKDCSFIANSATMCGGLLINNIAPKNTSKVKVLNSTFAYNQAINDGAAINLRSMSKDSEFTMVNCTVVDNITQGNGGHGAGLLITNDAANPKTNCTKRIYNCLFQGNYAVDGGKMTTSDLTLRDAMAEGEFEAYNTYFGRLTNNPILDGAAINCTVNYMPGSTKDMDWDIHNASGLSDDISIYATKRYLAPFIDENAPGLTFGNAEYLTQFGITTDQMGNPRKITGNSCAVGSLEMTEAEMDASSDPWNPTLTSISNTTEDKDQIEINVRNGEIVVGTGNNDANIQLYNMNGSILKATTGSMEITDINSGFYIVKAVVDNQISVKKIWIK